MRALRCQGWALRRPSGHPADKGPGPCKQIKTVTTSMNAIKPDAWAAAVPKKLATSNPAPGEGLRVRAKPGPQAAYLDVADGLSEARRQRLNHYESIIEESYRHEDQRAAALLAIHSDRLYAQTHITFADYLRQRWGISRSRGYQLLHLARLRSRSTPNGKAPPPNERQARQLAADGTPLPKPGKNSLEGRLQSATRHLASHLAKLTLGDQRQFLQEMRRTLDQLERKLDLRTSLDDPGATLKRSTIGPSSIAANPAPEVDREPSMEPCQLPATGTPTLIKGHGQPAPLVNTRAIQPMALGSKQSVAAGMSPQHASVSANLGSLPKIQTSGGRSATKTGVRTPRASPLMSPPTPVPEDKSPMPDPGALRLHERPFPQGNAGSLLGLSMEQARKLGYVR
jgi:hypothetical protein